MPIETQSKMNYQIKVKKQVTREQRGNIYVLSWNLGKDYRRQHLSWDLSNAQAEEEGGVSADVGNFSVREQKEQKGEL